jgi:hypothetical protein
MLRTLGFLTARDEPNAAARRLYDAAWVYDEGDQVAILHRDALLTLPATQALMQGLHGRGAVSLSGALHFMARHGMADVDQPGPLRGFLAVLNQAGIVAYSKKLQTVRITVPLPDGGEEFAPVVRVIEPDRPYSNVRHLREILRQCEGYIWWVEAHFSRKGLESLIDEADAERITDIRILSGPDQVTDKADKDWKRFRAEMASLGIAAEWRVVQKPLPFHDRFIVSRKQAWNVPPINTLYKGDYSEASRTTVRPPFEKWWSDGVPLAT